MNIFIIVSTYTNFTDKKILEKVSKANWKKCDVKYLFPVIPNSES